MKTEVFNAWAIDTKSVESDELFLRCESMWSYAEGCRVILFRTRKIARGHLKDVRKSYEFKKAKVVHVKVEISEIKDARTIS